MRMNLLPGTTSLAFFEHLFIFPTRFPLLSQADFSVKAVILSLQTSGLLESTFTVHFGFKCEIVAIDP